MHASWEERQREKEREKERERERERENPNHSMELGAELRLMYLEIMT